MPLTAKGKKIMRSMKEQYGDEKGESVFYASKNKGKIKGVEKTAIERAYLQGFIDKCAAYSNLTSQPVRGAKLPDLMPVEETNPPVPKYPEKEIAPQHPIPQDELLENPQLMPNTLLDQQNQATASQNNIAAQHFQRYGTQRALT